MSLHLFGSPVRIGLAIGLAASMLTNGPTPASASGLGPEKRLTRNATYEDWPELSGNRLVYSDYRHYRNIGGDDEEDGVDLFDIRVRNLKTGKDRLLTPKHLVTGRSAISGNRVVWNYYRNGRTDAIFYHNLKTGTHKRVPVAGGKELEISGTRICYERNARIYVYNFATKKEKAVSPQGGSATACDISGEVVVWRGDRNGRNDIYSYNLTTKRETRLTTDVAQPHHATPKISGRHVVWDDGRHWDDENGSDNGYEIYSYDLVTRVETRITTADRFDWSPNISGNRIVWTDPHYGQSASYSVVYAFNLATGVETLVSTKFGYTYNPVIAGNRVVYKSYRSPTHDNDLGTPDLYMRTIP